MKGPVETYKNLQALREVCIGDDCKSILDDALYWLYKFYLNARANDVFTYHCSEIKDPVDCGVHMLKPCLDKYFKDHNFSESTSKTERHMAAIALCHRIEEGLIDYLDELEEFNS